MEFEFDPAKSASNLEKHGIDFDASPGDLAGRHAGRDPRPDDR